jgi:hypothetical protein
MSFHVPLGLPRPISFFSDNIFVLQLSHACYMSLLFPLLELGCGNGVYEIMHDFRF